MHIIHIASEMAPMAKVGGLGDVTLGLCRELSWKGHDIDLILPKYDCMDTGEIRDLSIFCENLKSFYDGAWHSNTIWVGWVENLKVYFIDPHHKKHFFHRGCIYGCEDDEDRYLYFCRASIEFLYKMNICPDVLHLHDWQTAAIAPLLTDLYRSYGYTKPKTVFTLHNIDYQGKCFPDQWSRIGLNGKDYLTKESLQDPEKKSQLNSLKAGFIFSDAITTVSPSYAKEILLKKGGKGLHLTLKTQSHKLSGVLNGIDYSFWNPEIDRYLPATYTSREIPKSKKDRAILDNKAFVKKILREKLMIDEVHRPIVGCVTRLVPQKGLELIKHAIFRSLEKGAQFVLLGSSPIPSIDAEFHALKHQFADHPHVKLTLFHNEELAHLIFAGSDLFIVPSLFEPCGLVQLISLKYGSVPIVRRTGGLGDTIFDIDHSKKPIEERNGYTFDSPTTKGLNSALDRAIDCWFKHPDRHRKLMIRGMEMDYSWNIPSEHYLSIYNKIL